MNESVVLSNEDREVMDMSDYADDITPFFRNVSNLARPLYQGAKAAFDNIEQMLRSAPALIQTAKAMIPEETLQAVLTNKMKRIIALLLSLITMWRVQRDSGRLQTNRPEDRQRHDG